MAERSITVRLKADVDGLKRGFNQGADAAQTFGKKVDDAVKANTTRINTLSNGAAVMGLAMVAAAGTAVRAFADFDAAMSSVQAATMESTTNMALLRDAAVDAGARTAFSASEAAGAVENLAKAGVSTANILSGGLDGALDLAAAGQVEVAQAAEIAASAMTQFGLGGRDVSRIADVLAAGAGKAQGSVTDLGNALKYVGVPAAQLNIGLEEATGVLALFASNGILGEQAGTAFRSMLTSLTAPTASAAAEMERYGISMFDANGEFIGMEAAAGQLQSRLGGLSDAERTAALSRIVGNEALGATNALMREGADGVREWTQAVDDQGYAAAAAAIELDNLRGDLDALAGSAETALIGLGESADGHLRGAVQGATDLINAFSDAPDVVQDTTLAIAGVGGLGVLGVAGIGKLVVGFNEAKRAAQELNISTKKAGVAAAGVGTAVAVGTMALAAWVEESARAKAMTESLAGTLDDLGRVSADTEESLRDMMAEGRNILFLNFDSAYDEAEKMGISFKTLTDYVLGNADAIDEVNRAGDEFIAGSSPWEHVIQSREGAVANLNYTLDTMANSLTEAQKQELQKIQADAEAADSAEELTTASGGLTEAITTQADALSQLLDKQAEQAGIVLGLSDAQIAAEAAYDAATAALEENGTTLAISTEAGRANRTALNELAEADLAVIAAMREDNATQGELQTQMSITRDRFITTATAMGMGADEANRLADEMGLIPANVTTDVAVRSAAAEAALQRVRDLISGIPASKEVSITTRQNMITDIRYAAQAATAPSAQHAAGGLISGPGTGTSDSIAAWLSNGEYVIKASTVAKMPKSYWDGLNAGRFAVGGYVGPGGGSGPSTVSLEGSKVVVQVGEREFTGYVSSVADGVVSSAGAKWARQVASGKGVR